MRKLVLLALTVLLSSQVLAWDQIKIDFVQPPQLPYLVGQPEINIDADEFTTLSLRIKADRSTTARLFWASSYDPQLNEPKSVWFFIKKAPFPKEYVFQLKSQNPYWLGFIGQFALLPDGGSQGIEIISGKAYPTNFLTTIRSGWQEFWGPRGRLVIGSTINTIQSPNLFGRSIYVYVYWLIGGWIIGWLAWQLLRGKNRKTIAKQTFYIVIFFWGLLEISNMYSQYIIQVKEDWKYVGKSQAEKLALANYGDYYPFIAFCEKYLPQNSTFDFRIGGVYNDIKARYYLYPRRQVKLGDFLLVYDAMVEPTIEAAYQPYKTFRARAYIMKKR